LQLSRKSHLNNLETHTFEMSFSKLFEVKFSTVSDVLAR
jgi:hypothetical protein